MSAATSNVAEQAFIAEPANDGESAPADAGDVQQIRMGIDLARIVAEAIDALRCDPEIYVRAGALVRVVGSDGTVSGALRRAAGAPVVRNATAPWVCERLSVHVRFVVQVPYSADEREAAAADGVTLKPRFRAVAAPLRIATHIVIPREWPRYRALTGVVTAPTMRADGSVLQGQAGYDPASGLLYLPRGLYPVVPEKPTAHQIRDARARLLEVIADFPLDDLGRAGWLAMLLTLTARELVTAACPLFAVDAPTAGSGKGLLVACAHRIAHGVDAAHMSLPPNEEEFRKQITTILMGGDPAVLLDNVSIPIGGDSLDAVITAPLWKVRVLGKHEDSGSLIPRVVWLVTGNGLELLGDLGRRTLRIRIEPATERPEERNDYSHADRAGASKLLTWIDQHRAALVVDALTVLRGWHVDGRPNKTKTWGSFESWNETIGACVMWLGLPDPSLARATADATLDPARRALAVVFDAIRRLQGDEPSPRGVTAGDLVRLAFPDPNGPPGDDDLAEAIDALVPRRPNNASAARTLGRKLKEGRILNLPVDGAEHPFRLTSHTAGARAVRYHLEAAR